MFRKMAIHVPHELHFHVTAQAQRTNEQSIGNDVQSSKRLIIIIIITKQHQQVEPGLRANAGIFFCIEYRFLHSSGWNIILH